MGRKFRTKHVRYMVTEAIEIEPGVMLPRGRYMGIKEEHGIETLKRKVWSAARYDLELTSEALQAMGRKRHENVDTINYDLARFVKSGQVEVY